MEFRTVLEKINKRALFVVGAVLAAFIALILGIIIGISYPNWYNSLPFRDSLPSFLKPTTTENIKFGEKIVRTVEESAIIDVVEKSSGAVVSIVAKTVSFDPDRGSVSDQEGIGTGFIVDQNGIIVTNNHVVCDNQYQYAVVTKDQKTYDVKQIDLDPANDIAILKIEAKSLPSLEFGSSDPSVLKPGQRVIAIGNALGQFQNSVTVGVVSGLGRGITAGGGSCINQSGRETLQNVIQTDAALNPGNSGGPLIDLSGKVIGVNFAVSTNAQNIGFVIPIDRVKVILDQYKKDGRIIKPYLGIAYQIIDSAVAKVQNVPEGAFVRRVVSGSPADKAGIQAGDIVTKLNGQSVNENNDIVSILNNLKVGQKISIEVVRDKKTLNLTTTLTENTGN